MFIEVPHLYPSLTLSLYLFHVGFFYLSQTLLKRCAPLAATQDTRVQKSSHVLCCSRRSHNSLEQTLWCAGSFRRQSSFPALLNSTYVSICEREAKNGNQVHTDNTVCYWYCQHSKWKKHPSSCQPGAEKPSSDLESKAAIQLTSAKTRQLTAVGISPTDFPA